MANWLENLTGTAGTVLDTVQDVVDTVRSIQPGCAVETPPIAAPAATAPVVTPGVVAKTAR